MFCPKCGTESHGNFCPKCGTRIVITPEGPGAAPSPSVPSPSAPGLTCPVCRSAVLAEQTKRTHLGLAKEHELICPGCGSVLLEGEGTPLSLELTETKRPDLPAWKTYAHKTLSKTEWERIAHGGLSDEEQREHDLADALNDLREGRIPQVPQAGEAPLLLHGGEKVIYSLPSITLREPHSVSRGVYGGPSIRVAKGITIRTGGFQAQSHEELRDVDQGTLVLTNQRLAFAGSKRSMAADLRKLISVDAYGDAVAVRGMSREKTQFFLGLDHFAFQFAVDGRRQTEPFSGLVLRYTIEGLLKNGS